MKEFYNYIVATLLLVAAAYMFVDISTQHTTCSTVPVEQVDIDWYDSVEAHINEAKQLQSASEHILPTTATQPLTGPVMPSQVSSKEEWVYKPTKEYNALIEARKMSAYKKYLQEHNLEVLIISD